LDGPKQKPQNHGLTNGTLMNKNIISGETLAADLKRVVRDSEELLQDSKAVVSEKAHEMRDRLAQAVESAKATCRNLEEKTKECAKATDKVIRQHPYQFVGVAFGIGLLVGVLVARR
jgi:ElaB/YqjD/DUF883 family membrane-anchored ribosome-binding protein